MRAETYIHRGPGGVHTPALRFALRNRRMLAASVSLVAGCLGLGLPGAAAQTTQDAHPPSRQPTEPAANSFSANPFRMTMQLEQVLFGGNSIVTDAELAALAAPLIGQRVGIVELHGLLQDIRNLYKARNIPGVTVGLPLDDIRDGTAVITIAEPGGQRSQDAPPPSQEPAPGPVPEATAPTPGTPSTTAPPPQPPAPAPAPAETAADIPITQVNVSGVTQLSDAVLNKAVADMVGQPFSPMAPLNFMQTLKRLYRDAGLPLPQIRVPLDAVQDGVIALTVTEAPLPQPDKAVAEDDEISTIDKTEQPEAPAPTAARPMPTFSPTDANLIEIAPRVFVFKTPPQPAPAPVGPAPPKPTPAPQSALPAKPAPAPVGPAPTPAASPTAAALSATAPADDSPTQPVLIRRGTGQKTLMPGENGIDFVERPDDDLLILEVIVSGMLRDGAMLGYLDADGGLILPLQGFADALGFPIEATPEQGLAEGWFVRPDNTFRLDMRAGEVTIGENTMALNGAVVEAHYDDIYVSAQQIMRWFPLGLRFNFNELRLYIDPDKELPFESYARRRALWQRLEQTQRPDEAADAPTVKLPYQAFAKPALRLDLQNTFSQNGDDGDANQTLSIQGQGDLLWMSADLNAVVQKQSGQAGELSDVDFTLSRVDPDGRLLGPLRATEVALGDVDMASLPLLSATRRGRGATVSNQPAGRVRDPDNFVLSGNAPQGWDVEVYQDEQLLDFQTIGNDGRYEFTTLPLKRGLNLFRVVAYGPNGEETVRVERFFFGNNMLSPGRFYYDVAATESSDPLIPTENGTSLDNDAPTAFARGEFGLYRNLSVAGGLYSGPLENDTGQAASVGLRGSLGNFYSQLDVTRQDDGAGGWQITSRGELSENSSLSGGYTKYTGYAADDRDETAESYVRFDQRLEFDDISPLSYSLEARRETFQEQQNLNTYLGRISTNLLGFSMSNELTVERRAAQKARSEGELTLQRRVGTDANIRGRLRYQVDNDAGVEAIDVRGQKNINEDISLQGGVTQTLGADEATDIDARLGWKFPHYILGLSAGGSTRGQARAGLNLTTYLSPKPQGYAISGNGAAAFSQGSVDLRAFVDVDQDGVFTQKDEPLHNVTFKNRRRGHSATTAENGIARLDGLTPFSPSAVEIDVTTLPDIYMQPAHNILNILPHPGYSGLVDVPVTLLGEISGSLSVRRAGHVSLLPDIPLHLYQGENRVATAKSEYDGFFIFPSLPMGLYQVRIPEHVLKAKGITAPSIRPVRLTPQASVDDKLDIIVAAP